MRTRFLGTLVTTLLLASVATVAMAGDSVVGTLTVKGKPIQLKAVTASLQTDPDDSSRTWLVILASDVPVAPGDQQPARLAELARAGKLQAVRVLWLKGFDTVFAVPYHQALATSGRRAPEHPIIDLERFDDARFEGKIQSRMVGQEWFFQAQVKAALATGGVAELESEPAEEAPSTAGGAGASEKTKQKVQLGKLGYEYSEEAFHSAITDANVGAVKLFLAIGMSPNTSGPSDEQPLAQAVTQCAYEHEPEALEMATALLGAGAKVDAGAKDGITPLLDAAQHCKGVEVVKLLLDHGANVNTKAPGGATPMMFAKIFNKTEMMDVLKKAGAHE
jgi:uncharacterized protein